jgi:hypothetical protein
MSEGDIVDYIMPSGYRDKSFWKKNWPIIKILKSIDGILLVSVQKFQKSHSRDDGLILLLTASLAWQEVRQLANIKGSDDKHMKDIMGDDAVSFPNVFNVLNNIRWLFDVHSKIRHPTVGNISDLEFIFSSEWPLSETERLLKTAGSICNILSEVASEFSEKDGFEEDVCKKQKLAQYARSSEDTSCQ